MSGANSWAFAQQTADQAIADARREADNVLGRARREADEIVADALSKAWVISAEGGSAERIARRGPHDMPD